jgi:C-terminal processing protease CtpA/Prc
VPFAFSLGTAPGEVEPETYAANMGAHFTIVYRDFWNAAKLTRTPGLDTPAGRAGLQAGDVITTLDDLPIWGPIDVFGHHLDTKVDFLRDGKPETRTADLPRETPFPPGVPPEQFSRNFVMSFQLIPFGKHYGARITRMLTDASPLKRGGLETGDTIVLIDGQLIDSAQDVANHARETDVVYIDVRTGLLKKANVNLP